MMQDKIIVTPDGVEHHFPAEATEEQISEALNGPSTPEKPSAFSRIVGPAVESIKGTVVGLPRLALRTVDAAMNGSLAPLHEVEQGMRQHTANRMVQAAVDYKTGHPIHAAANAAAATPFTEDIGGISDAVKAGDAPSAIGHTGNIALQVFGPKLAGKALEAVRVPAESRAVSMVQNSRKIQDPAAARFLLEQDAAGGPYAKLQKVADAANARTTTVMRPQPDVPSTVLGADGRPLGAIRVAPVAETVKDPTAWRGFYGLKNSLDKTSESPLGREGAAAYVGHSIGGPKAEALAIGASALTRTGPRSIAAQKLFNLVTRSHPEWTAAQRAIVLSQMMSSHQHADALQGALDGNQGGS